MFIGTAFLAGTLGCRGPTGTSQAANPWLDAANSSLASSAAPIGPSMASAPQFGPAPPMAPGVSLTAAQEEIPASVGLGDVATDEEGDFWLSKSLSRLSGENLKKDAKKIVGQGPNEEVARAAFAEGEGFFRQSQYADAVAPFETAMKRWPDSALEEDALFMLGESCFFSDQYSKANQHYAALIKKYGASRHLDRVMQRQFAIARYWEEAARTKSAYSLNFTDKTRPWFDASGNALATYEMVWMNDPTGPLADDSVMATANAYFVSGRFRDADYYYNQLRSQHPKSEHQLQAHLLGLAAKLETYEGPSYDGAALDDAEKLIKQILMQFSTRLSPEARQRVLESRDLVQNMKAEREWLQGQYYDQLDFHRAASVHYQNILQRYANTRFAPMAAARMVETKDLPPRPPDRFRWLTNLFGEGKQPGSSP